MPGRVDDNVIIANDKEDMDFFARQMNEVGTRNEYPDNKVSISLSRDV